MERFDVIHRGGGTYRRRSRSTAAERDEHGTLAGWQGGCRCGLCRGAFRKYHRLRYLERQVLRTGALNRRVPVARAQEHINVLMSDAGWSAAEIADAAGCSAGTVWRIARAPKKARCWLVVESAILAIDP